MPKIKKLGIIAPASATEPDEVEKVNMGIDYLKGLGLDIVQAKNIFNYDDNGDGMVTAGTIKERVDGFHEIWSQADVDAVISVRGGYGSMQLLDQLDFEMIKKYSKPLIGYSDLTALHLALNKCCGIQSIHAPMVSRIHEWHDESRDSFAEMVERLSEPILWSKLKSLSFLAEKLSSKSLLETKIMGGNLTLLSSLIGSKYLPDFSNSILFIEEYNEPKYQVDRKLWQLYYAGIFDNVKAILVGIPTQTDFAYEFLDKYCKEKDIPLIKEIPIGHCEINLSLPIG